MQDTPQDAHWGTSSVSDPDYQREQREKNERARRLVDEAHLAAPDGMARADQPKPLEHIASADCWCEPEVDYVDPDTGATVYVHRSAQ